MSVFSSSEYKSLFTVVHDYPVEPYELAGPITKVTKYLSSLAEQYGDGEIVHDYYGYDGAYDTIYRVASGSYNREKLVREQASLQKRINSLKLRLDELKEGSKTALKYQEQLQLLETKLSLVEEMIKSTNN